jgi:hypothetical protein
MSRTSCSQTLGRFVDEFLEFCEFLVLGEDHPNSSDISQTGDAKTSPAVA